MDSVQMVADWPVPNAAAVVLGANGASLGGFGDLDREYPLASVTKLFTAYATLIAVEEGAVEWDQPAGPDGSTVRHLIAHASGLAYNENKAVAAPGTRRLYSNTGFEVLASTIAEASGIAFADYLDEAVFQPLGMKSSRLAGSPAAGGVSTANDLVRFAAELQSPDLIATATFKEATQVVFPGLSGVLPGLGHQRPNDWGLGFELRDHKSPHWTGVNSSPRTFGHFGQSGTFLWVDPDARAACVALTDRDFGDWAKTAWPAFTDGVLAELP
ncbi:MAG TPA: serine hydrolase domain-containing protein [Pseudonocardiaceae bacterium]|nr:serine hydrolase domain-containing protein [Pseudonocardiaceae bacterium]